MLVRTLLSSILIFVLVAGLPAAGKAQLIPEQLILLPGTFSNGAGTVRLDGMSGFLISVPDENNEINLWDYAANPAGFGDDKDSWSVDLRYSHREKVDRNQTLSTGTDLRQNFGTFLMGYYSPGKFGVGGFVDYAEAEDSNFSDQSNFRVVGFSLTGNLYIIKNLSAGLSLSSTGVDKDTFSNAIYNISHNGSVLRGSLGLAYHLFDGVSLGARGDILSTTIDGTSENSVHKDLFTWERPGYLGSLHLFVDRGRLQGVVDYTAQTVEGAEKVNISWSPRFVYNPGPTEVVGETDTFSEDRSNSVVSTRWMLDVIPRTLSLSVGAAGSDRDFTVVTNPNALGSLERGSFEGSGSAILGGLSYVGIQKRLLLAAEVASVSSDAEDRIPVPAIRNELDELTLRIGGEYLLGETFAGRLGFSRTSSTMKFLEQQAPEGDFVETETADFDTDVLSVGIGLVPNGAIWQLDFAYDVVIKSTLDADDEKFSAYVRYLF